VDITDDSMPLKHYFNADKYVSLFPDSMIGTDVFIQRVIFESRHSFSDTTDETVTVARIDHNWKPRTSKDMPYAKFNIRLDMFVHQYKKMEYDLTTWLAEVTGVAKAMMVLVTALTLRLNRHFFV
jgi:hypothetical protein